MTQASVNRHVIARVEELPPGSRKIVTVRGREIGVFNVHGAFYALRNLCPHRSGPLCKGRVRPFVEATDRVHLTYTREGEILKCPWHQWEFDLQTGQCLVDRQLRVKTYEVRQEGDEIALYA